MTAFLPIIISRERALRVCQSKQRLRTTTTSRCEDLHISSALWTPTSSNALTHVESKELILCMDRKRGIGVESVIGIVERDGTHQVDLDRLHEQNPRQ